MDFEATKKLYTVFRQLEDFDQSDLDLAKKFIHFNAYQPKDYIFCQGDFPPEIHFVIDGIGRYFYIDHDGNERNKSLVRIGGAFASVSTVVDGSPSPFYTQALTPCLTASITYKNLLYLADSHRSWGIFLRRLYERLVIKKEQREASFLMLSAKERYLAFLQEFEQDSHQIPLRHIAMYLGITDVTLSRIRREMGLT
ncbi:Crp/Fnr family transcriptional regulator [Vibrio sp. Isolate23]|uniref:Crp/Fnr family transcriptional regulator n=1 Tax=unclassified Vibrio TaxID=2614977 RepID=UPI001EFE919F|nr:MULTISPECIES: Crp/Fnr family transcriptional regulator [unclassified Vibrio]MCG9677577.1 Crp/Fnr family transcriptional regulator [Vibrio sp. Isolate24]MCG9682010.1 Crp/Fnr family transcriptional regulator [Vibrio sp. Isolate23]